MAKKVWTKKRIEEWQQHFLDIENVTMEMVMFLNAEIGEEIARDFQNSMYNMLGEFESRWNL